MVAADVLNTSGAREIRFRPDIHTIWYPPAEIWLLGKAHLSSRLGSLVKRYPPSRSAPLPGLWTSIQSLLCLWSSSLPIRLEARSSFRCRRPLVESILAWGRAEWLSFDGVTCSRELSLCPLIPTTNSKDATIRSRMGFIGF